LLSAVAFVIEFRTTCSRSSWRRRMASSNASTPTTKFNEHLVSFAKVRDLSAKSNLL